jgi:hypothetical protein
MDHLYEILGLKPGASLEELKRAYRDLAQVWHPDRFPGNPRLQGKAQEKLKDINAAYEQLLRHHSEAPRRPPETPRESAPRPRPASPSPPHRKRRTAIALCAR